MAGVLARVRSVMESSPFLRHVLTLVSGTATAQAIVFGMTMVLTRIFSDADRGQLTRYTSIVLIITAVAALRYDMTIMLPKKDAWALACARLGMVSIVVVSVVTSVAALLLKPLIARQWGNDVAAWMPLLGLTTLLLSTVQLLQYWYNRQSDYRTISINRVEQQVGQSLGQLVLGAAGMVSVGGLLIGQTIGQAWAFVNLGRKAKPLHRPLPPEAPTLWQVARRYRRMPLLNGLNAFVDAVRLNGINLLVGSYSVASLGQFNLAWTCLEVPLALINAAVGQVFFHKLATLQPGQMRPLVRQVIKRVLMIGTIPFALLFIVSPWLFPLLFGGQWVESGDFARALTPWLFILLVTSPLSNLFVVTENQDWMLIFSVVYAAVPLAWLWLSPYSLLTTTYVLGAIMCVILVGQILMADAAARGFDSRPPASEANEGHYEAAGEPEPSASVPATDSHDEEQ